MQTLLPQPPRKDEDAYERKRWFDEIWKRLGKVGGLSLYTSASASASFVAAIGYFYNVDATAGVVTVTPPAIQANADFYVRKSDASANMVTITGLGDIAFQGTCIHFISTGTAWVPA
jgi:hypothetical protein